MVNNDRMEMQLELHEGVKLEAYEDTLGNWTIATGYNLSARSVDDLERVLRRPFVVHDDDRPFRDVRLASRQETRLVLRQDIDRVQSATRAYFPYYDKLDEVRQRVVLDMAFNLGFRALTFQKARAAVERRDFTAAVKEIYRSKWAYQVDDGPGGKFGRADRLASMLLTGKDYTK